MNEVLRDEYVGDNEKGIIYFNKIVERHNIDFRFSLPHRRFNRRIGMYSEGLFDLQGNPIDRATWEQNKNAWLPSREDREHVMSLMKPCHEQGKIAGWIAPPQKGIDGKPFEYEYVKL
jgi:benzoyl-CoA 2,3-dioxygenase component B